MGASGEFLFLRSLCALKGNFGRVQRVIKAIQWVKWDSWCFPEVSRELPGSRGVLEGFKSISRHFREIRRDVNDLKRIPRVSRDFPGYSPGSFRDSIRDLRWC